MSARPRLVLFGSGSPVSLAALEALAGVADVVAVVTPAEPIRGLRSAVRAVRRRRASSSLRAAAGVRGIALETCPPRGQARVAERVSALESDAVCVATFPFVLERALVERPAYGLHPSPLPRHRGPAPLFWTYFGDDREAGVSVIRLDAGADTGGVLRQETFALARGRLGSDLYAEIARRGAALLAATVTDALAGRAAPTPQDEQHATHEPAPRRGRWSIDYGHWSAERLWHFLRGVGERGRILSDAHGRPLRHGPALSFTSGPPARRPGTVEAAGSVLLVHCRDGRVEVAR